jgi:uncharacterized protein Usg
MADRTGILAIHFRSHIDIASKFPQLHESTWVKLWRKQIKVPVNKWHQKKFVLDDEIEHKSVDFLSKQAAQLKMGTSWDISRR